jgi:hypothetical protein
MSISYIYRFRKNSVNKKFKNDGETYYTPLEKYLYMVVVKNKYFFYSIITYLKGESDELLSYSE